MTAALFGATLLCIVANLFIAIADYSRAGFVLANSAEVHVPAATLPYLATLKLAGALGLIAGLVLSPGVGLAAGIGLVLFFVGAVLAHLRARVYYNIAFPGAYLLLAVAASFYFTLAL